MPRPTAAATPSISEELNARNSPTLRNAEPEIAEASVTIRTAIGQTSPKSTSRPQIVWNRRLCRSCR